MVAVTIIVKTMSQMYQTKHGTDQLKNLFYVTALHGIRNADHMNNSSSSMDVLDLFWPLDALEMFVRLTNLSAYQVKASYPSS